MVPPEYQISHQIRPQRLLTPAALLPPQRVPSPAASSRAAAPPVPGRAPPVPSRRSASRPRPQLLPSPATLLPSPAAAAPPVPGRSASRPRPPPPGRLLPSPAASSRPPAPRKTSDSAAQSRSLLVASSQAGTHSPARGFKALPPPPSRREANTPRRDLAAEDGDAAPPRRSPPAPPPRRRLRPTARSDLVISRADRKVDLTSHIVRVLTSLKVENVGPEPVSQVLLAFPNVQAKNLAAIRAFGTEGKVKGPSTVLPIEAVQPSGVPPELTFFSASLPKALEKGKILHLDVLTVFTHSLQPFPEEITQAESQLVIYQDSAHYLSPYPVKVQTLSIRLPVRG